MALLQIFGAKIETKVYMCNYAKSHWTSSVVVYLKFIQVVVHKIPAQCCIRIKYSNLKISSIQKIFLLSIKIKSFQNHVWKKKDKMQGNIIATFDIQTMSQDSSMSWDIAIGCFRKVNYSWPKSEIVPGPLFGHHGMESTFFLCNITNLRVNLQLE